jgi:hypothetical protein
LVYSVHFKSNRGGATTNIVKREEAARQLLAHVSEMESVYSGSGKVVTINRWRFQHGSHRPSVRIGEDLCVFEGEIGLDMGE